ncbi:MAG: DUF1549 domain-containing protein [Armatimonadetes bacterium]|nr:DUF1549 domain-containing protein [Armatimonadota bacterium]
MSSQDHRCSVLPRRQTRKVPWLLAVLGLGIAVAALSQRPATSAPDPIALINEQMERAWKEKGITPAALCDDRTFVRRIYLDLVGRIPTVAETEAFLAETAAGKRTTLVDRLLASPEYAQHMRDVFDVVFMGRQIAQPRRRRGFGQVAGGADPGWDQYLERQFAQNRPWNEMLAEILLGRPTSEENKAAVWFLYNRQERYQEIAEAIPPVVFGVQIQCAQCHDHPLAAEIKQAHYWGLVAFFNRTKNRSTSKGPRLAESAIGGFSSFATLSGEAKPALLSFLGAEDVEETRPAADQKEEDKPDLYRSAEAGAPMDDPLTPKFSRREQFVEKVVRGSALVPRAAVNRFWALLMGRGMVHPVDKMDSAHPPSHPALLDALAQDFAENKFDMRRLVRSLVLSRPYQLDSRRPEGAQPDSFSYALEKPLIAESLYRSLLVATTGKTDGENPELLRMMTDVFPDVFAEENQTSLRQSMFLTNNPAFQKLFSTTDTGSTAARLMGMNDPAARVREAFRVALHRDPAQDELAEAVKYLMARADRPKQAVEQFWWALLTGAEFRFNH